MKVTRKTNNVLMGILFLFALFGQIDENLARPNSASRITSNLSNKPIKRGHTQSIFPPAEIENEDVISPSKLEDIPLEDSATQETSGNPVMLPRQWLDLEHPLPASVNAQVNGDLVLKCMAVGSPPPSIYWLKDGKPIENTAPFDTEKLQNHVLGRTWFRKQQEINQLLNGFSMAKISSIIPLRCLRPEDEGQYTCVADNGVKQASSTTIVSIKRDNEISEVRPECEARTSAYSYVKKGKRGVGAVILSHETLHMELIGNNIVLPCRVSGRPRPAITWLDPEGKPVLPGKKFQITHSGNLIIRKVSWAEMGEFTCVAENPLGTDSQSTFLYPLANESS